VIYARGLTDSVSLKLTSRAKVYDVKLFNPRTGNIKKIAEKKKIKNEFNWLPPDQEDWIVVLEKCVE